MRTTFESNDGQWDQQAMFRVHGAGNTAFLAKGKLVMDYAEAVQVPRPEPGHHERPDQRIRHVAVAMHLDGSNPDAPFVPGPLLDQVSNYYLGSDPSHWITGAKHYATVTVADAWPGIDVLYHGGPDGGLKYDFIVQPGASPDSIALRFEGHDDLTVEEDGRLAIHTALGTQYHDAPYVYQEVDDQEVAVSSHYQLIDSTVGFVVGDYDESLPLIVDPLIYSTFIQSNAAITDVSVDNAGNAYISGSYYGSGYPTTLGAYDTSANGKEDGVVTKLNPTGDGLLFSTYFGGSETEYVRVSALDNSGNFYVTGSTQSTNFPTSTGAYQNSYQGGSLDGFAIKFSAAGTLVYSTYLGGSEWDDAYGIAADDSGNAYVTGTTLGGTFPTTVGAYDRTSSGLDGFLMKLAPSGTTLLFSTYVALQFATNLALDASGVYMVGSSNSVPGVSKMDLAGTTIFYTYAPAVPSGGTTYWSDIAVDSAGSAYVTGGTTSSSYPTTSGVYDGTLNGEDAVVTKLNPVGAIMWSTLLGGSGTDKGYSIVVDASGPTVAVSTSSSDYPSTANAYKPACSGSLEVAVTRLNALGSRLDYSSCIGTIGWSARLGPA